MTPESGWSSGGPAWEGVRTPRHRLVAIAVTGLLLLGAVGLARGDDNAPVAPKPGAYAGSDACARCHPRQHAGWAASVHARSVEVADEHVLPGVARTGGEAKHPPGQTRFHVADGRFQAETAGPDGAPTKYSLSHVVGKRRIQMFLATMPDGRLQVLPGMYAVPSATWFDYTHLIFGAGGTDFDTPPRIAPGDASSWTGAVRSFDARCARCHVSGYASKRPGPGGVGPRSTWRELGVGCEACHGPAGAHTAAWSRLDAGAPLGRLEKLPRVAANDVCLRCHMEAEVVSSALPEIPAPGTDLYERLDPTLLLDPERVDAAGRVLELIYEGLSFATSRCAAEGRLRCADCHDPHGSGHRAEIRSALDDDRLCTRCHEDIASAGTRHTHHAASCVGASCIACHMGPLRVERRHGLVHDHSISIPRLGLVSDRMAQDACSACHAADGVGPRGAPQKSLKALQTAYATWWPDAPGPAPWIQALAAARAQASGGTGWLPEIIEDRSNPRVVRASAVRLLERDASLHTTRLLQLIEDEDSLIRRSAATALAGVSGPRVNAALQEALSDPSLAVRRAAARAAVRGWRRVEADPALLLATLAVLTEVARRAPETDTNWFDLAAARDLSADAPGALAAYRRMLELQPLAPAVRARVRELASKLARSAPK